MSRYTTELIWPPFKGKAHKVVDTSTGAGVGLYRTPEGARRKAKQMNEADVEEHRRDHFHDCTRCGQTVITRADVPMCATCKRLDRAPQGETVRLFEPAPTQLEGQMSF